MTEPSANEPELIDVEEVVPGGRVARYVHRGDFEGLPTAWALLEAWIGGQRLTPGSGMWEVYLTEPTPNMDPADLRTELNWSVSER